MKTERKPYPGRELLKALRGLYSKEPSKAFALMRRHPKVARDIVLYLQEKDFQEITKIVLIQRRPPQATLRSIIKRSRDEEVLLTSLSKLDFSTKENKAVLEHICKEKTTKYPTSIYDIAYESLFKKDYPSIQHKARKALTTLAR